MIPARLRSPRVGLSPTMPLEVEGPADGSSCVGAVAERRVVGGNRDAGAARGTRGGNVQIMRIVGLSAEGAHRSAGGELGEIYLGENDCARFAELF